jgi:hypothetical protein
MTQRRIMLPRCGFSQELLVGVWANSMLLASAQSEAVEHGRDTDLGR